MGDISTLRVDFPTLFCKVANYTLVLRVGAISTLGVFFIPRSEAYFYSVHLTGMQTVKA